MVHMYKFSCATGCNLSNLGSCRQGCCHVKSLRQHCPQQRNNLIHVLQKLLINESFAIGPAIPRSLDVDMLGGLLYLLVGMQMLANARHASSGSCVNGLLQFSYC